MGYKIQIEYDSMQNIANLFANYASDTQDSISKIESCIAGLEGGGWIGGGAAAFYDEMHNEVLPRMKLLQTGFEVAGEQVKKMISMFEDAEQVMLSYFASL